MKERSSGPGPRNFILITESEHTTLQDQRLLQHFRDLISAGTTQWHALKTLSKRRSRKKHIIVPDTVIEHKTHSQEEQDYEHCTALLRRTARGT